MRSPAQGRSSTFNFGEVELRRVGVRIVGGGRGLRRARAAGQREILAFIEIADAALVEAGFIDLQIGAVQRIRRQFLDREAHGFGRGAKSPIRKTGPLLLADSGWE